MSKRLKNATKKITAVAAASAILASSAFGAGLGSYPSNFVKNGEFNGQIVVGAAADAMDTTNANAIIADLKAEFSGEADKVKITYKKSGTGGEEALIADSGKILKFGQTLTGVRAAKFDDRDFDVLSDETLRVGSTNKDFTQEFEVLQGSFEHSFRDRLEDEMSTKLFFDKGNVMRYTLDFSSDVATADVTVANLVGKKMTIMGNQFTVGDVSKTGGVVDELKLLGGANTISLGEGESSTVEIDGKTYEVEVIAVSEGTPDKVLLSVNGQTKSVDEYETELIGGVRVAVTDLVSSSRDSVKGYAEIVVGGSEIVLKDGDEVVMNDEDISDIYDDYKVTANFVGTATDWSGFTLTYEWLNTNGFVLREGEVFEDKVFNAIGVKYDGTNDVDYSTIEVTASSDNLRLKANLIDGTEFDKAIAYGDEHSNDADKFFLRLVGNDEEVPMLFGDVDFRAATGVVTKIGAADLYTVQQDDASVIFVGTEDEVTDLFAFTGAFADGINVTGMLSDKASYGLTFLAADKDTQYLYEMTKFKVDSSNATATASDEYSFKDLIGGKVADDVKISQGVASKLTKVTTFTTDKAATISRIEYIDVETAAGGFAGMLALEGDAMLSLGGLLSTDLVGSPVTFTMSYDEGDLRLDDAADAGLTTFTVGYSTSDDEITVDFTTMASEATHGGKTYISSSDKDVKEVVDAYGTVVRYDSDEKDEVIIKVPDRQVEGKAYLVSGAAAETKTMTVDADKVDEVKADLKADGYTVVSTDSVAAEEVEFDVTSITLDTQVSGMNDMIVVGGPAVNAVARQLMGIDVYTLDQAGVAVGEGIIKYYENANSVLVYGYSKEDTTAAVAELNNGGLSGNEKKVN